MVIIAPPPPQLYWILNLEWRLYFEHTSQSLLDTCPFYIHFWHQTKPHTTQIQVPNKKSNPIWVTSWAPLKSTTYRTSLWFLDELCMYTVLFYIFCPITLLSWWDVLMGPTVDSRIETPNDGNPILHIKYEVKATEHNSLVELCNALLKYVA